LEDDSLSVKTTESFGERERLLALIERARDLIDSLDRRGGRLAAGIRADLEQLCRDFESALERVERQRG
jgi:hypothetical protein